MFRCRFFLLLVPALLALLMTPGTGTAQFYRGRSYGGYAYGGSSYGGYAVGYARGYGSYPGWRRSIS